MNYNFREQLQDSLDEIAEKVARDRHPAGKGLPDSLAREDVDAIAGEVINTLFQRAGISGTIGLAARLLDLPLKGSDDVDQSDHGDEVDVVDRGAAPSEIFQYCDKLLRQFGIVGDVDVAEVGHKSSPSVDDAGAHSVGDGQVAGVETAAPAPDADLDVPFIDARYNRPMNCIILSCDGSEFAALDRDSGFAAIDRISRALEVQAKLGGVS